MNQPLWKIISNNISLANGDFKEERWVTDPGKGESGESCPICKDLEDMGWVKIGTLPPYRKAHSIIGEGKWKTGDDTCNCIKEFR